MPYIIGGFIGAVVTFVIMASVFAARKAELYASMQRVVQALKRAHADQLRRVYLEKEELKKMIKRLRKKGGGS